VRWGARGTFRSALSIFLEIIEERRLVAILHAFENSEMQFKQLFHRVEDAARDIGLRVAGSSSTLRFETR